METTLLYFLKVNIAITGIYLFFRIFLSGDTFFKAKRFSLLSGILFAFLYPLINLNFNYSETTPIYTIVQNINVNLPEVIVSEDKGFQIYDLVDAGIYLYILISILLIVRVLYNILRILRLKYTYKKVKHQSVQIICIEKGSSPFSFFNTIYLNPDDYSSKDLEEILHHENVHVKQLHSLDVIIAEILCSILWLNPFTWLLRNLIRENLEYLADRVVIKSGIDMIGYQYHLLRLTAVNRANNITNNFNVTKLKNRIIMMNKKKTPLAGLIKYALILPVLTIFLMANNVQAKDEVKAKGDEKAFYAVEVMPQYPGGEKALTDYIIENLKYPDEASKRGVQGTVLIRFIIDEEGNVTSPEVIRGIAPALEKEAMRVITKMPKWIPGKQSGKNVKVYFTIPIMFKMSGNIGVKAAETKKVIIEVDEKQKVSGNTIVEVNDIFSKVDVMPEYPGGVEKLMEYIMKNLSYPEEAKNKGIEGRVIVRFVVDKDGKVISPEVIRGLDESCNNEALRVVKEMPNWKPGSQDGRNVPVFFTLPITYKLDKDSKKPPLYIVNDKVFEGSLKDIKPEDILSVTVLKDSAAIHIYGQKGADGVILITTKDKK